MERNDKRADYYNIVELTRDFESESAKMPAIQAHAIRANLAQAQQLSVISGHLAEISEALHQIVSKAKEGES